MTDSGDPSPSSSILLVGSRGAGKTTIGHALARTLDLPFYDTDRLVEERLGESIPTFWAREGEEAFRQIEGLVVESLPGLPRAVIATGGGIVLRPENRKNLQSVGRVFYIRLRPETLIPRLQNSWGSRPRLMQEVPLEEEVRQVMLIREPLYLEAAHHVIDADGFGIFQVVQVIQKYLEEKCDG
ncbi:MULTISPECIES: shikimate kinase [Leptospirillum]|jgi:shikimate kinase|uniref:Shikimate kinase n=3 Tax=Leptospirillum ferriphilum TaxID=178606 RepID=A0A059XTK5_9BACT|nr:MULTISPECIES: shikimate kinase [Leptospirillum]EAY55723.1 MAG: Shikimate kinase [Leptospirillum rubarum]EIJ75785.1 MAG: Shikimate kinase [Leptospirillum sp. Group II 'C75']AFS53373.1 shikimate kinase [Leptospirillum ferriphilum ML-04]AIA30395.1 shikimate kinase [Leptospirillum ferriphilum YSK]AKS23684.1 hypothetical protein ABH19_07945 [Leptospirillum sp. Group II 'CF-1']